MRVTFLRVPFGDPSAFQWSRPQRGPCKAPWMACQTVCDRLDTTRKRTLISSDCRRYRPFWHYKMRKLIDANKMNNLDKVNNVDMVSEESKLGEVSKPGELSRRSSPAALRCGTHCLVTVSPRIWISGKSGLMTMRTTSMRYDKKQSTMRCKVSKESIPR